MPDVILSVVVPLGPHDDPPAALAERIARWNRAELIVSGLDSRPDRLADQVNWQQGPAGRGRQLNRGAAAARGKWLWFVHADSEPAIGAFAAIERFIDGNHAAIGYCRLRFLDDGPRQVALNAIGANLRSRLLGLPYGDQGLCLPANWFRSLGGFREDLDRGEDLDFVVRARQAGLPARPVGATIRTSARRYREKGWLATTWHHQIAAWRLIRNARHSSRSNSI
jgi:GT2 family glycosyltransferase